MPCEPIIEKGKVTGFICSRSRGKPKPPPCYKCGKPSTKLCDFRDFSIYRHKDDYGREHKTEIASLDTCDKPMCDDCANHVGEDTDFCDDHNNQIAIARTAYAERLHRARAKRFGIED